jgi:hypothetical protein
MAISETTDPSCLTEGVGATSIVPSGRYNGERTGNDLRNGIFMLAAALTEGHRAGRGYP